MLSAGPGLMMLQCQLTELTTEASSLDVQRDVVRLFTAATGTEDTSPSSSDCSVAQQPPCRPTVTETHDHHDMEDVVTHGSLQVR